MNGSTYSNMQFHIKIEMEHLLHEEGLGVLALMRPDSLTNTSLGSLAVQSVAKMEDDLHKNIFGVGSG